MKGEEDEVKTVVPEKRSESGEVLVKNEQGVG